MKDASNIRVPTSRTHISQSGAAEDQSRAVGQTDIRPSIQSRRRERPRKRREGKKEQISHSWQAGHLGDSRSRNRPDGWHIAGWLARQAKFLRRFPGRVPERRGGSLEARRLRGLRGCGHGMLNRLFAPDAELS
jgi:hypothetical protein